MQCSYCGKSSAITSRAGRLVLTDREQMSASDCDVGNRTFVPVSWCSSRIRSSRSVTSPGSSTDTAAKPERRRVFDDQPVRDRMERAAPHPPRRRAVAAQRGGAGHHVRRRAAGERQQQHPLGRHPALEQRRDPTGERAGLAGAGAGHDHQRPVAVLDGTHLRFVQIRAGAIEHGFEASGSDRSCGEPSPRGAVRRNPAPDGSRSVRLAALNPLCDRLDALQPGVPGRADRGELGDRPGELVLAHLVAPLAPRRNGLHQTDPVEHAEMLGDRLPR